MKQTEVGKREREKDRKIKIYISKSKGIKQKERNILLFKYINSLSAKKNIGTS